MNWKNVLRKRARIRARQHFARHLRCYDPRHDRPAEVHHADGDVQNGAIENLVPVCRECHVQIHVDMRRCGNPPQAHGTEGLNTSEPNRGSVSR